MRTSPWAWRLAGGTALTLGLAAVAGPRAAASALVKPPCCRVPTQSAAVSWGNNFAGELGNGVSGQVASPSWTGLTGLISGVVQVSGGSEESLALTSDGQVWAWGGTNLGTGASSLSDVQVPVPGLASFPGFAELKRSLRERPQLRSFGVEPEGIREDWHGGSRRLKK